MLLAEGHDRRVRVFSLSSKEKLPSPFADDVTCGVAKVFGDTLRSYILDQGMTLREFDRKVGKGNGYVAHVCRAASPPPDANTLSGWCSRLQLNDEKTGELLRLADIARAAHTPRRASGVAALQTRIDRAEQLALELFVLIEALEKRSNGTYKVPEQVRQRVDAIRKDRN